MKFVLLAAGKGHRLDMKLTNKCFAPINNIPLINYSLELVLPQYFDELIIIVGHNAEYIMKYMGESYHGIKITYVYQEPQLGIAHAILLAAPYINSDFMMCLSDEITVHPRIMSMMEKFIHSDTDCLCGVTEDTIENIQKAYTLSLNSNNLVTCLIEKPIEVFNKWKGTGLCLMRQSMLSILTELKPNQQRGEYEMGNWIQLAIDTGLKCRIEQSGDANFNINTLEDAKAAENYLNTEKRGE